MSHQLELDFIGKQILEQQSQLALCLELIFGQEVGPSGMDVQDGPPLDSICGRTISNRRALDTNSVHIGRIVDFLRGEPEVKGSAPWPIELREPNSTSGSR